MQTERKTFVEYQYIDSEKKSSKYLSRLREKQVEAIALDIEGESNLHHYGERLCLVQVFDGKEAAIIDPFKVPTEPIRRLIEDRTILKIMYDAPGDRAFLYKNCEIDILSVLDLRVAVELLNFDKKDLSSVLKKALQVQSGKSKKRLQRYNWNRRPLDDYAIAYALADVIHLFELKDHLLKEIIEKQLLERFIFRNLQVQNKPHVHDTRPKLLRSKRFRDLTNKQKAIFKQLFALREDHAQRMDYPANAVFANDLLFDLASAKAPADAPTVEFGKRIPQQVRTQITKEMRGIINPELD